MSEPDALSALLGERMERQHREMMRATIAGAVIGNAMDGQIPAGVDHEDFLNKVATGAWVIAERAMSIHDALKASGKLP